MRRLVRFILVRSLLNPLPPFTQDGMQLTSLILALQRLNHTETHQQDMFLRRR